LIGRTRCQGRCRSLSCLTLILGAAAVIAGIVDENINALRESWDGRSN
jgi:hypothetical protein